MGENRRVEGGEPSDAASTDTAHVTHDLLILRARYWLENTVGAKVVLTEFAGGAVGGARRSRRSKRSNREIPDAIGWLPSGVSLLIECKASRADFLSDADKPSRRSGKVGASGDPETPEPPDADLPIKPPQKTEGLGAYRFYLAPSGLLHPDELPEGWGLLELRSSRSAGGPGGTEGVKQGGDPRYSVRRSHDPLQVFDPRTGKPRRGLPDTRTRGTLQKENGLALSALRLVQLRDLHGQELSPSRAVYRNLGGPSGY